MAEHTDLYLALEFFKRLNNAGFKIEINDYNGRGADFNGDSDHDFDWNAVSFDLLDMHGNRFASFDFLDKKFYRISAIDSTGGYYDEVDGRKYR